MEQFQSRVYSPSPERVRAARTRFTITALNGLTAVLRGLTELARRLG
jgi:hypothetical protein